MFGTLGQRAHRRGGGGGSSCPELDSCRPQRGPRPAELVPADRRRGRGSRRRPYADPRCSASRHALASRARRARDPRSARHVPHLHGAAARGRRSLDARTGPSCRSASCPSSTAAAACARGATVRSSARSDHRSGVRPGRVLADRAAGRVRARGVHEPRADPRHSARQRRRGLDDGVPRLGDRGALAAAAGAPANQPAAIRRRERRWRSPGSAPDPPEPGLASIGPYSATGAYAKLAKQSSL